MLRRSLDLLLSTALAGSILSCAPDRIDNPREIRIGQISAAKPVSTAPAVTSASPAYGDQGLTLDVHVHGSGFASDAQVSWLLHGAPDPHVQTNKTTFVSSTDLVANITIAGDAQLAFWDVGVRTGGKNGVGSEAFEVTSAQIIGSGSGDATTPNGMNDLLEVVGQAGGSAWIYDTHNVISLGAGSATAIDPLGEVIVGWNGSNLQTAWVLQSGAWVSELLPRSVGSVGGEANAIGRRSDGTLIVGGTDDIKGPKRSGNVSRPAVWQRGLDGAWSGPQFYQVPPGVTSATIQDINPLGQAVGFLDVTGGVVWDSPTTFVVLDGIARRINPSGTLIVGNRNNGPGLYWYRDKVTHAWHTTGIPLPSVSGGSCPEAMGRDVTDAGVVVGWSCTPSGKKPTAWRLDFSGSVPILVGDPVALPGLGVKAFANLPASASAVTESAPYVVAGNAYITTSQVLAVTWRLP